MRYEGKGDPDYECDHNRAIITRNHRRTWLFVFSHCGPKDLCIFAQVCKEWKALSENKILWKRILLRAKIKLPKTIEYKDRYRMYIANCKRQEEKEKNIDELDVEGSSDDPSDLVKEMWGL